MNVHVSQLMGVIIPKNSEVTIWLFNIAMENGPFMDDFPTKTSIYKGFSMAMLNNQMVYIIYLHLKNKTRVC